MSATAAGVFRAEVDQRPLLAKAGRVFVTGWCLDETSPHPPAVRLATEARLLPATKRTVRQDIARLFPNNPAAANAGFEIEGTLTSGIYVARLEAQRADGTWHCLRMFSLAVERPPFTAVIDDPIPEGILRDRVKVGGWALQPDEIIAEISIRYGHRELPCDLGGQRTDVPRQFPAVSQAGTAGFKTRDHLVAGHGPVRIRGRLVGGQTIIGHTPLIFSVKTDENHGPELNLEAKRIGLPAASSRTPESPVQTARPLNVLFILYGSFASNSALHVAALANELAASGHGCVVAVPHDPGTLAYHEKPAFQGITYTQAEQSLVFPDGRGPEVIHAWTSRENVRNLAEKIRARYDAKLIVHLEDNERQILTLNLGQGAAELANLSGDELDRLVPADLSHPVRGSEFIKTADGVTMIIDALREWVPDGRPCVTLMPAADERHFFPRPIPHEFRQILDVTPGTTVLFYPGNVHAANAGEMRELYAAVLQLNRSGQPVTLIRTGLDRVDFPAELASEVAPFVLNLGQILYHRHLPALMALADIFVQPGQADAFNDYRFPSKLPEFFSLGRPVILPRTNLGRLVRHGIDAYVLERADAQGIAAAVAELRSNPALSEKLAQGALAFAAGHFSWRRSAETLAKFYASVTT